MKSPIITIITFLAVTLIAKPSLAQHSDVLMQNLDDRLTSGDADFDSGVWSLGARVYTDEFDSSYAIDDPGWNALGAGSPSMPGGASALPGDTDLEWDFLPMKIDGTISNLFYWDGSGSVNFGATPTPDYKLYLQAKSSNFIPVDGSDQIVPGEVIDDTDSSGGIHRHRFWFLDDEDGDLGTDPVDGIYLLSLRTRMIDLDRSAPLFFLFGTPGSTSDALNSAKAWISIEIDNLSPDYSVDTDGDLDVDGRDFLTWQQNFGTTGTSSLQILGDADFNNTIDNADHLTWEEQFGSNINTFAGAFSPPSPAVAATIPEPSTILLAAFAAFTLGTRFRLKL